MITTGIMKIKAFKIICKKDLTLFINFISASCLSVIIILFSLSEIILIKRKRGNAERNLLLTILQKDTHQIAVLVQKPEVVVHQEQEVLTN